MACGTTRLNRVVWHIFDGADAPVGRLATRLAILLMGKHKPTYSPHMDHGDNVVVVNAEHLHFSGRKHDQKLYRWHTGNPSGLRELSVKHLVEVKGRPEEQLERAVSGMLPKNYLRRPRLERLKVFRGEEHPYWQFFSKQTREAFERRTPYIPPEPRKNKGKMAWYPPIASSITEAEWAQAVKDSAEFLKNLPDEDPLGDGEIDFASFDPKELFPEAQLHPKPRKWRPTDVHFSG
jgi:large subunit ribosomal protein L13